MYMFLVTNYLVSRKNASSEALVIGLIFLENKLLLPKIEHAYINIHNFPLFCCVFLLLFLVFPCSPQTFQRLSSTFPGLCTQSWSQSKVGIPMEIVQSINSRQKL